MTLCPDPVFASVKNHLSARRFNTPTEMNFPLRVGAERVSGGGLRARISPRAVHARGAGGPTYYVDPALGSNTNSGLSWDQALRDPFTASMKTPDAAEIVVRGGFYTRAQIPTYRRSLIIRAEEGTRPIFACCDTFTTWEVHTGTLAWRVIRSNVASVLDRTILDEDGDPIELTLVGSAGEVAATPGSWYTNGPTVYVRTHDSRTPDANILLSMNASSLVGTGLTGNWSLYVEGIEWWGGTTANILATGDNCLFLAKDSTFKFANSTNGLSIRGVKTVVLENCEASKNRYDGFNYHEESGRNGNVVEINCVARKNGKVPGSQNGSTAHESYKIVRIGGLYEHNVGANVADVNNALSYNIGVTARNSTGYDIDFYGINMWLEQCVGEVSATAISVAPGGIVRTRDCVFEGDASTATPY